MPTTKTRVSRQGATGAVSVLPCYREGVIIFAKERAVNNLPKEQEKELENLSYFKDIRERRAWIARMTVLIAVLGLLILNIFLMYISANAIILNIDLARLEQSDQFDLVEKRLELVTRDMKTMRKAMEHDTSEPPLKATDR